MDGLRNALGEAAERAKVYDVTERAVRVARRRRQAVRLAPVAVAAVVVAVGLVAVAGLGPGGSGRGPEVFGGQQGAAPPGLDWLPERLDVPETDPEPLPATGVVGRGVLLYGSSAPDAGPPVLLTEDNRRYRLAEPVDKPAGPGFSVMYTHPTLSPDGRWLGEERDGRYVLRDLTGDRRFELDRSLSPVGWSPGGQWLLFDDHRGDDLPSVRVDLSTGDRLPVVAGDPDRWRPVGVLDSGDVLVNRFWDTNGPVRRFEARIVDPRDGVTRSGIQVDLGPYLEPGEQRTWDTPLLSPDGRTVAVSVVRNPDPGTEGTPGLEAGPGHLLVIDLASGQVRRTVLPYTRGAGGTVSATPIPPAGTRWSEPLAYLPDGVLLRQRTSDQRGEALLVLDPATGAYARVTELPDRSVAVADQVLPRGV